MNYQDREDVWIINREYKPGQIKNKNELPKSLLTKMIMYSSNEDDIVCDFFLGSFSTAKVAIGLGRKACGFEINPNAFSYQQEYVKSLESKYLLNELRDVPPNKYQNKGKQLNDNEIKSIINDYSILMQNYSTKKQIIEKLSDKYGRGYWSILKVIDNASINVSSPKKKETSLFA